MPFLASTKSRFLSIRHVTTNCRQKISQSSRRRTQVGSTNRGSVLQLTSNHAQATVTTATTGFNYTKGAGSDSVLGHTYGLLLPKVHSRKDAYEFAFSRPRRFVCNKEVPDSARNVVSATWSPTTTPEHHEWKSEQQAMYTNQTGLIHPADPIIKSGEKQRQNYYLSVKAARVKVALERFRYLLKLKYGTISGFFQALGLDEKENVSLSQLTTAIVEANLEPSFPRTFHRVIFENVEGAIREEVPYKNLLAFVEGAEQGDNDGNKAQTIVPVSSSNNNNKQATDDASVDEDERYRLTRNATYNIELEKAKVRINRKVNKRCRELKLPNSWPAERVILLNALKQRDYGLTGQLPAEDVINTLMSPGLYLQLDEADVKKVVQATRKSKEGQVLYRDLVNNFLELIAPEPSYDALKDRRIAILKRHQEAFNESTHWDPELSAAVIQMRRERFEGAQRVAQEKAKRQAAEEQQQQIWKAAEKQDSLIEGPNRYTKYKAGIFDYVTIPKDHIEKERPVTSSSELFADIAEKNHQKSTFICPRIPRSCPPTDWSRVGYGGDGIDRQAKGMYTDSKEQLTTTMESDYPEIIYEPNHPPRRQIQSACEKGAEIRRQRVAYQRGVHETHIARIMRAYAVEQYDKKMMDDVRVKTKRGQALEYLKRSQEQDYFKEIRSAQQSKKTCRSASKKIWGGSPDQQFNILLKERNDERDFQSLYSMEFAPLGKRRSDDDGLGRKGCRKV